MNYRLDVNMGDEMRDMVPLVHEGLPVHKMRFLRHLVPHKQTCTRSVQFVLKFSVEVRTLSLPNAAPNLMDLLQPISFVSASVTSLDGN